MSKLIHALSNATALADPRPAQKQRTAPQPARPLGRPDALTAQRIEVGLVLNTMLGAAAASDYLARQAVNAKIAQRVLSEGGRRRKREDDIRPE